MSFISSGSSGAVPALRIAYEPGEFHFGDLRLPGGSDLHAVAIVIHGGFWRATYDLEHTGPACVALTEAGIATWSLEYRRMGHDGGGWPGTFKDVVAGARHLEAIAAAHKLDMKRVVVVGHSAGGHLALLLGAERALPLRGVVSLAGVADLRRAWVLRLSKGVVGDFLGGSPDEIPELYTVASPIERLPIGIPQRLIHGTADRTVPFEISERYVQKAQQLGDDAALITLEGASHFEVITPSTKEFVQVRDTILSLL
jgi:acetyl esterase/lipase